MTEKRIGRTFWDFAAENKIYCFLVLLTVFAIIGFLTKYDYELDTEGLHKTSPSIKSTAVIQEIKPEKPVVSRLVYRDRIRKIPEKQIKISSPQSESIISNNQSGGITAHTVNIGDQPQILSEEHKAMLLQYLPDKNKEVDVWHTTGSDKSAEYAQLIRAFLKSQGYGQIGSGFTFSNDIPKNEIYVRRYENRTQITIPFY